MSYEGILQKLERAQAYTPQQLRVDIIQDIVKEAIELYNERLQWLSDNGTLEAYGRVARLPSMDELREQNIYLSKDALLHNASR